MAKEAQHAGGSRRGVQDIVGLDFGSTAVKVVRLRQIKGQPTLQGAALLPPVALDGSGGASQRLTLPLPLLANYAAVAISSPRAMLRLVTLPPAGAPGAAQSPVALIKAQFTVGAEYRTGYTLLEKEARAGRGLAVALPEQEIRSVLSLLASGPPAARSLELAGLCTLSHLMATQANVLAEETVCLLETGAQSTLLSILHRGQLVLVRKYEVGGKALMQYLEGHLKVDRETALTILTGGGIDISAMVTDVLGFIFKQVLIARDFVERQEKCRVQRLFVSGGLAESQFWRQGLTDALSLEAEVWPPLGSAPGEDEGARALVDRQPGRFAAALGAALNALEPEN